MILFSDVYLWLSMYVVFFLLIITGNYIWGELVVPHYRNVFSGVLVVFFLLNLLVVSSLEKVFFAYLVFFLLLYHFIFSEIQTYFLYLSIYLYLSLFYLFKVASTLGTALLSPLPWMFIPYKEYWYICCDSILACCRSWLSSYSMILPLFD